MKDYVSLLGQQVTVRVLYPLGSVEPWDNDDYERVFPVNWGYADAFWENDEDLLEAYILEEQSSLESDALYSGKVLALLKSERDILGMVVVPGQAAPTDDEIREKLSFNREWNMTTISIIRN